MPIWNAFVLFLERILLTFYHWGESIGLPGSGGLAIILFTIVARLVILPLTIKSIQSTRRMQELQPLMKELQRKHGKDAQKLQEETMKLYREYKVNPAGGCLPMFLQLPIFLGVYQAVINLTRVSPAERSADAMIATLAQNGFGVAGFPQALGEPQLAGGFLWLSDLGKVDSLYILPVLSVVFQLIVQLMATPRIQDPQQKAMTQSMLFLPVVFGYIGFTFPSGAVLYWVVGSILSMIQQYVISGWGSLANYLKFLPTEGGLLPPVMPTPALAATAPAADEPHTQKADFWGVLRPLMEQGPEAEPAAESSTASEQVIADTRRQLTGNGQINPRRRKSRR
jgi:YidC/Oxa1 family membrane protein insertase